MISRCGLMQKKDGMGMEEFKDYWLNVHGLSLIHISEPTRPY